MKFYAKISSSELGDALKSISAWDGKTRLAVENILQEGTRDIARGAKQRVSVRTGTLKKNIRSGFNRRVPEGIVRARTPYAHLVEFGAKAYTVRAKKKKALTINSGSQLFLRKSARIPARKGRPFIKPAFEAELPRIISDIKKALR